MRNVKKLLVTVVALAVSVLPVGVFSQVEAQSTEPVSIFSIGTVRANGITRQQFYNFVTDITNDSSYWPGVEETVLVQEGNANKVGTIYIQQGTFAGFPFNTEIEITAGLNGYYIVLEGSSPALNYTAVYTFNSAYEGGARFTTTSVVTGVGISPEFQTQYITAAFTSLLSALGTTGDIDVPVSTYI
jgi:hypothetical protein